MKSYHEIKFAILQATVGGVSTPHDLARLKLLFEEVKTWANMTSEKMLSTHFFSSAEETTAMNYFENDLLELVNAFGIAGLNGAFIKYGTLFSSDERPQFTIYGVEFYAENGKKYSTIDEIPVDVVVCYWYNDVPRGWFMKLTNHADPKKPLILELKKTEVDY